MSNSTIIASFVTRIGHSAMPKDYAITPKYHNRNPHRSSDIGRTVVIAHYIVWAIDKLREYRADPTQDTMATLDKAIDRLEHLVDIWPSNPQVTGSVSEGFYLRSAADVVAAAQAERDERDSFEYEED